MAGETGPASAATTEFRAFLDEDWRAWLNAKPELGSFFGVPGHDDRWTDDSPEGIQCRRDQLERTRRGLARFQRASLSPGDQLDFDLYQQLVEEAGRGAKFGDEPFPFHMGMPHNLWMPLNQLEGVHLDGADAVAMQARTTVANFESILARLASYPALIQQNIALLRAGLKAGYSTPRAAVHGVPATVERLVVADPWESALLEPFLERPTTVGEAEWDRLRQEARTAYLERDRPALEELHRFLRDEYLPACRATVGCSDRPDGVEAYAHYLRWQTTTDMTAQQIHDTGLAELDRIRAEMEKVRAVTGFAGSLPEFFSFLRTDPRFFFSDAGALIEGYRALAKRIDPELPKLFGKLPRLPYGVMPMPAYKAPSSPAAYYFPGAPTIGRPGVFYANTHNLAARPRWEMEDLVLHEAVPGHHLESALTEELPGLPEFRRRSGYTAFIEGWGLYAETLGAELGLYKDPYSRMGQLIADAWRSTRLVVDTGIHALGWSRERAIRFFTDHTGRAEADVVVEVDRYIVWPGQAVAYKIGQLRFSELRRQASARLGERFDVRGFHDTLLGGGGLPLSLIAARVDAWARSLAA